MQQLPAEAMYHTMVHIASSVRIDTARPTGKSVVTAATVMFPMEQAPRLPFPTHRLKKTLRRKTNFLSQINLICPVQSPSKKYFCFSETKSLL
jgi:hypothetical protein